MLKLHSLLGAVAVCAALAFGMTAAPSASAASCTSSVPATYVANDSASDSEFGVAPELTALRVSIDGSCGINFSYDVIGQTTLIPGEFYSWFIDTDNSTATGTQGGYKGADHSIGLLDNGYAALMRWNGVKWDSGVQLSRTSTFGVAATLNQLGAESGRSMWVAGGGSWTNDDTGNSYYDLVPDNAWLGVKPVFPASSGPAPVGGGNTPGAGKQCRVPKVRGLSLSAAKRKIRNRNCKVGKVYTRKNRKYAGRAFKTSPAAGARRPSGSKVAIYVGKGGKAASASIDRSADRVLELINELDQQR